MRKLLLAIFYLSTLGTLFAASVTVRQAVAPATQPGFFSCVGLSVFGLSPCPYGLGIFALLALMSGFVVWGSLSLSRAIWPLRAVGLVGVVFSGWVVWREVCLPAITLGQLFWERFSLARVPACAWGFLVFIAVFVLSLRLRREPPSGLATRGQLS